MNAEIETKLKTKAMRATVPFCYRCQSYCPCGQCFRCGSDDLMTGIFGVGVGHGLEWAFEHLVGGIESVDTEAIFEHMMKGSYNKTSMVGPLEVDTLSILKENSAWWQTTKQDYLNDLILEDELTKIGDKYYWTSELEKRL